MGLLFLGISFIFLLAAWTGNDIQYKAKASEFENPGFQNDNNLRIVVIDTDLVIIKHEPGKTIIDKKIEADNAVLGEFNEVRYKNVKIKTKKNKYYITTDDGISLKFKKIATRVIVDEDGVHYFHSK